MSFRLLTSVSNNQEGSSISSSNRRLEYLEELGEAGFSNTEIISSIRLLLFNHSAYVYRICVLQSNRETESFLHLDVARSTSRVKSRSRTRA